MLNQIVMAGRLTGNPETKELENGKKVCYITVAVPRSYKNVDGTYDTDFIDCQLWNSIADTTAEYCQKGDIVGIKGRIETSKEYGEGNIAYKKMTIVAEKVSFLSSGKRNENDKEE